jgi:outer membrane lipoprotein SlyB
MESRHADAENYMSKNRKPRSSIFTGLLLILLGVIFLIHRYYPEFGLGHLIRVYWPVLIILGGVAKLIEYLAARDPGDARPAFLSGGEVLLMILLAFVLIGFVFHDWLGDHYPELNIEIPPLHQTSPQSKELAPVHLPAGAHVVIDTMRGDISVHASDGDELRVSVNETASAANETEAQALLKDIDVAIEQTGNTYTVHIVRTGNDREWVSADFDLQLPKTASLTAHTNHGDINASGIGGDLDARTESGDVEVRDAKSNVSVVMQKGDAHIARVAGNLRITGRGSDLDVSDVKGDVILDGTFLGSASVNHVAKTTRYTSPRADITISQLNGNLAVESNDIEITGSSGPARIVSQNKDVKVENVAARLDITNSHGDVTVELAAPLRDDVYVANDSADVDLTLPARSGFEISAISRSGDVESDFEGPSLKTANEGNSGQIAGKFGSPGPKITINTTYGTIHLRKGS